MVSSIRTSRSCRAATAWLFQVVGENDYYGYDDETEVPDRAEAERAVNTVASLFAAT